MENNFLFGKNAGLCLTKGHHNVFIGENAGSEHSDACYNFIIKTEIHDVQEHISEREYNLIRTALEGYILHKKESFEKGHVKARHSFIELSAGDTSFDYGA
jgi:hypothetical protein